MLHSRARWNIGQVQESLVQQFTSAFSLSPLLARLLVLRGIQTIEQAELFLHGGKDHFHDPFLLDGMRPAVDRIRLALERREKIRIYGDYDADGVSSTSLMVHLLRQLDAEFDYYIPHRVREGYGLNRGAIDLAYHQEVSLIITVDTGISSVEEAAYIQELGMDVIITDHHEPPERLPEALAIINPKKPGCPYPFKQLAGVGVALKVAHALTGCLPEELMEMAAIGTVADLMPLVDENRLIVKMGLKNMRNTAYAGIKSLLSIAGVDRKEVTASHIGFALAPRINASGRLECADDAVKLLITSNDQEAENLAFELDALNKERQRIVEDISKQAIGIVQEHWRKEPNKVIIVAEEDWNVGVIGIVASKIVEKFYRPTIILSIDSKTGIAKGSARSIAGFDMYQALTHCKEWLDHFGGHQAAAGMSLHRSNIEAFSSRLNELADEWLSEGDFSPILKADMECHLSDVPLKVIEQLELLAPFGIGNPSPKFVFSGLQLEEIRTIGKEKQHLKLSLSEVWDEVSCSVEAVGFGKGTLHELISPTAKLDVLGELSVNEWNGKRKPQLLLQDLRVPQPQLFDWRGTSQPKDKCVSLLKTIGDAGLDREKTIAIVLFSSTEMESLVKSDPAAVQCPLWVVQSTGELAPGNDLARMCVFEHMSDVLLYTIPRRIEHLEFVVRQAAGLQRCYALFADVLPELKGILPTRDMFKSLYAMIRQQGNWDLQNRSLLSAFSKRSGLSPAMIEFIISVFEELGFIQLRGTTVTAVPSPDKKDLSASHRYQDRLHRAEVEQICFYSSAKELEQHILTYQQKKV